MPEKVKYQVQFCQDLLAFFNRPAFTVTEVQKRDGSISLVESACELPTFSAFAQKLGVTRAQLRVWEEKHPPFAYACEQARDRQGDILIQNSLRGNYASSFAMFTAKNLLGWKDSKDADISAEPVVVTWEANHEEN